MPTDTETLTPPDHLTGIGFKDEDAIETGPIGPVYWITKPSPDALALWTPLAYLSSGTSTTDDPVEAFPHPEWFPLQTAFDLGDRLKVKVSQL